MHPWLVSGIRTWTKNILICTRGERRRSAHVNVSQTNIHVQPSPSRVSYLVYLDRHRQFTNSLDPHVTLLCLDTFSHYLLESRVKKPRDGIVSVLGQMAYVNSTSCQYRFHTSGYYYKPECKYFMSQNLTKMQISIYMVAGLLPCWELMLVPISG